MFYNNLTFLIISELTNNLTLKVNAEVQIPHEDCGVFAGEYDSMLWTFFGSIEKEALCYDTFLTLEKKKKNMPILFENDASAVRVGHHLWIIGGNVICGSQIDNKNIDIFSVIRLEFQAFGTPI